MKKLSLKTKMALAVSALFVGFVALLTHFVMSYLEREFKATISDQQFTLASSLANSVDDELSLIQNMLIAAAARLPSQALTDPGQAQHYLDGRPGLLSIFDSGIFLISKEGRLLAESPRRPERRGRDVSSGEFYRQTMASREPHISKPYISARTPGAPAIMITAPVFDRAGNVLAILSGSLDLTGNNFLSHLTNINIGRTGYIFLISSDRTIIMPPDRNELLKGSVLPAGHNKLLDKALTGIAASDETLASNGVPVLASYRRLHSTDWFLVVHYPLDEAYAPFHKVSRYVTLGILAGTVVVLLMVWAVMRRFTQPLTRIARHMEESPGKPGEQKLLKITSGDEIGTLASAFNKMIIELDNQEKKHDKLQAQLMQAQKMESIGRLAGGVAHDFNNMLTAIIGFGGLLRMKLNGDEQAQGHLDQMLSAAEKAAGLSKGLLAFSRQQRMDPKPIDLSAIVSNMKKILSRVIGEDIEFKTSLKGGDLVVMADSGQIEQVLLNLVTNARDAMPVGGQLIIETGFAEMDHDYIKAHGYGEAGKYALISVTDTGTGMDEATKQKIFEPFFTTKEVGQGTGLGLAMVYGIIKQHNGYVNVYSEPSRGTTFRLYLPLIRSEACKAEHKAVAPVLARGTETILVIEDDARVRQFSRTALESFGYRVIEAVDGEDALRRFEEHKDDVELLLLDVIMPKKNGREVYNEIKKMRPGIKVIFSSGYTGEILADKGIIKEKMSFISKPMSPHELLSIVRETLDGKVNHDKEAL
jgi:signal transduction histidine kinase/ActR/RegA family two-component response regulator